MRITTVDPIKCAALLNITPPSFAQMHALTPACTTRKVIRNKPVKAITHFFPIEDENNSDQFISKFYEEYLLPQRGFMVAKITSERQNSAEIFENKTQVFNRKESSVSIFLNK